jgi:hypothetical protein
MADDILTLDESIDRLRRSQQTPVTSPSPGAQPPQAAGPPPAPSVLPALTPEGQPLAAPAPTTAQPTAAPAPVTGPTWKTHPTDPNMLGKPTEGHQYDLQDGMPQFRTNERGDFVTDSQGHRIPKTITKEEAKRKADIVEQNAGLQPFQQIVTDARGLTGQPGFDAGLKLGKVSSSVNVPYGGGTVDLSGPARRMTPDDPGWSALDEIGSTQQRLNLTLTRVLAKSQGTISDFERRIFEQAIGSLQNSGSKADFQFRLNSIERMGENLTAGKPLGHKDAEFNARPTTKELAALKRDMYAAKSPEEINAKVEVLAKKYKVSPEDMSEYVMIQQGMMGRGSKPEAKEDKSTNAPEPGLLEKFDRWTTKMGIPKDKEIVDSFMQWFGGGGKGNNSPETLDAAKKELSKGR